MNMQSKLLTSLEDEYIQILYRWKIFLQLYDSGPDSINLLNSSGSNVFKLFQKLVIDDTMLALCRLTDPGKSFGKENASIDNYIYKADLSDDQLSIIRDLRTKLDSSMKPIRGTRKWAIAHSDFSTRLNITPLPKVTYDSIENSIKLLGEIMSIITKGATDFDPHIPSGTDGRKLIKVLKKAHGNPTC